ncbi:MAG: FkbM family methyltransferase [Bacteroidetes bacterium]|nr:MAG: FkbM family methyltransferase [Bacteroidota bacterium]
MLQLIREQVKNWYRFFSSPAYREWLRIKRTCRLHPPQTTFTTRVNGYVLHVHDSASLLNQYESIFVNRAYDFHFKNDAPVIFCCGANMGLEILYFKRRFPAAKIQAFEADEKIVQLLHKNVEENAFTDVIVHHAAVWTSDGDISFEPDGAQGGRAGTGKDFVKAVRLADLLENELNIDLLVMDIEGAEYDVLRDCKHQLHRIDRLFVEWHSRTDRMQHLDELLVLLQMTAFRYRLGNKLPEAPFINAPVEGGFDAMVEIYAERSGPVAGRAS